MLFDMLILVAFLYMVHFAVTCAITAAKLSWFGPSTLVYNCSLKGNIELSLFRCGYVCLLWKMSAPRRFIRWFSDLTFSSSSHHYQRRIGKGLQTGTKEGPEGRRWRWKDNTDIRTQKEKRWMNTKACERYWSLGACRSPWKHVVPCWAPADITPVEAKRACRLGANYVTYQCKVDWKREKGRVRGQKTKRQLCGFHHLTDTAANSRR